MKLRYLACVIAVGCADPGNAGPASGIAGRQVRSLCDSGNAYLLTEMKLTCSDFPPSPESGDPSFWSGERPCGLRIDYANGDVHEKTYDYTKPFEDERATYDDRGNLSAYDWSLFFPDGELSVSFEYQGSRLTGVTVDETSYLYRYEGGRRVSEGVVHDGEYVAYWHYVYDDGRLVAEGPPVKGEPPVPLTVETAPARVPQFEGDFPEHGLSAPVAALSYVYDGSGRITNVISARTPGMLVRMIEVQHDSDRLTTVTLDEAETSEPTFGPQTRTYRYDCN